MVSGGDRHGGEGEDVRNENVSIWRGRRTLWDTPVSGCLILRLLFKLFATMRKKAHWFMFNRPPDEV